MRMTRRIFALNRRSICSLLATGALSVVVLLGGCAGDSADHRQQVEYFDFSAAHAAATHWSQTEDIDFGTPDARESLISGWSVDELWGGDTTFVWGIGEGSELRFDRFSRGDLRLRLHCRPLVGSGGPLTRAIRVAINGIGISEVELQPGTFRTYEVLIPSESLSLGENRIVFQYDSASSERKRPHGEKRDLRVAWDWMRFDSNESEHIPLPADGNAEDVLMLRLKTRTDFFVELRPGSRIEWAAARAWNGASKSDMELHIEVETDDADKRTFVIRPSELSKLNTRSPALPPVRAFARISFLAVRDSGEAGSGGAQGVALYGPRLVGPSEPHEKGSFSQTTPGKLAPPITEQWRHPNIIVYLIDALRADHLGVYGYSKPVSPEIDAFAADAVVFERAFAQSSWTKTSVASILSGLFPLSHGTFHREDLLHQTPDVLPGLLHEAGYQTMAVSASTVISPDFGFDRGFEEFHFIEASGNDFPAFAYSDLVTDRFLEWISARQKGEEPFFAYIHTLDPHEPYGPPDLARDEVSPRPSRIWELQRHWESRINEFLETHEEFSELDVRDHLLQLYDRDISFNDRQFGRLIEALKDLGIYDSTVIVLLSDHGEEFLDHGHWTHGQTLYIEQLDIPLLLKLPHQRGRGLRVSSTAQQVDVAPTLLEAAGLDLPSSFEGKSLLALIDGLSPIGRMTAPVTDELVLSNLRLDITETDSLLWNGLHLIRWKPDKPDERVELYDLAGDPQEKIDLSPARAATVGFLRTLLRFSAQERSASYKPQQLKIEGSVEERLRALGYVE